jgi:hypothetical protein
MYENFNIKLKGEKNIDNILNNYKVMTNLLLQAYLTVERNKRT